MYGNNLRITGLSGIDTEEMINDLMKAERVKVDRVEQDKQLVIWRQEMYNEINKEYANFILNTRKDLGLTSVTSTGYYVPNSYENLSWVKKATSSDEAVATVDTTAKAMDGVYDVYVEQLAKGVSLASSSNVTVEDGSKANLAAQFGLENGDVIEFSITTKYGTKNFKFNSQQTLTDIAKAINSAKIEDGEKEVSLGVRAIYDSNIDRFFLQTKDMGEDAVLKIDFVKDKENNIISEKATEKFINGLNLQGIFNKKENDGIISSGENVKYNIGDEVIGQNAKINFNGADGIEQSSNQFTINGINFNLKEENVNFKVTVDTDVDAVYEKIEKFVEEYNKIVDMTSLLLDQKRYRDYRPLTAEQKKEMEKKDIELWEEKAKSGLLRSDELLSRAMRNTRSWLYEEVDGASGSYKMITEIGISTESYSKGSAGGKLQINEQKLKQAILDDPNGVLELLFKEPDYDSDAFKDAKDSAGNRIGSYTSDKELAKHKLLNVKRKQSGLVTRIYDNLIMGMQDIVHKAGTGKENELYRNVRSNMLIEFVTKHGSISYLDDDMDKLDRRIDDLNYYLVRKENHYYAKFSAMEKAITRMNQQSMWLMQQFTGN